MKNSFSRWARTRLRMTPGLSAILFLCLVAAVSCKKEGDVVPDFTTVNLGAHDTVITIASNTENPEPLATGMTSLSLCGILNDATFGLSEAEFYSQLKMSKATAEFGSGATVDSVILQLQYDDYYGFVGSDLTFQIHELDSALNLDSVTSYMSDEQFPYKQDLLAEETISTWQLDSNWTDSLRVVKIDMSTPNGLAFAQGILDIGQLNGQEEFLQLVHGLRISVDGSNIPNVDDGTIMYFNSGGDHTWMTIYYTDGQGEPAEYEFQMGTDAMRYTYFEHDHAPISGDIDNPLSPDNHVQAMVGVNTNITIKDLEQLRADLGSIAINKAILEIPYQEPSREQYRQPTRLFIITENESGDPVFPIEFVTEGEEYLGGTINTVSNFYSFNLTRTMHEIIIDGDEKRLTLLSSGSAVSADRVVLNSGNSPANELKLRLTYTKY